MEEAKQYLDTRSHFIDFANVAILFAGLSTHPSCLVSMESDGITVKNQFVERGFRGRFEDIGLDCPKIIVPRQIQGGQIWTPETKHQLVGRRLYRGPSFEGWREFGILTSQKIQTHKYSGKRLRGFDSMSVPLEWLNAGVPISSNSADCINYGMALDDHICNQHAGLMAVLTESVEDNLDYHKKYIKSPEVFAMIFAPFLQNIAIPRYDKNGRKVPIYDYCEDFQANRQHLGKFVFYDPERLADEVISINGDKGQSRDTILQSIKLQSFGENNLYFSAYLYLRKLVENLYGEKYVEKMKFDHRESMTDQIPSWRRWCMFNRLVESMSFETEEDKLSWIMQKYGGKIPIMYDNGILVSTRASGNIFDN